MDRAKQVRAILSTRGVTLFQVSRRSAEIFERSSQFYIPHNLYYDLAHSLATPTIFQFLALSHITDYRLTDWLAALGFDLDAIARLQLQIPWQHTTILDPKVFDTEAWIPWFSQRPNARLSSSIAPLTRFLTSALPKRARDLVGLNKKKFSYAVVGARDLYAVPYFVPGSIIRVDIQRKEPLPHVQTTTSDGSFFLVEHDFGWTCSRLVDLGKGRVLLHCPQMPCAEREVDVGKDARILGAVDAEIRRVDREHCLPLAAAKSMPPAKPEPNRLQREQTSLKDLLQSSRARVGLSFREASSTSRWIADRLSDELYFAAVSTLSDYEALSATPRHVQKIITLCLLYRIGLEQFLRTSGFPLELAGRQPIPDELVSRDSANQNHVFATADPIGVPEPNDFITALLNVWEEIPLFLRFSLDEITRIKKFSLSDVFWIGGDHAPQHPLLANSTFVVVNRRARKPSPDTGNAACEQSFYLLLRRDGRYLCGRCTLDGASLTIHGYPGGTVNAQQFRNGIDAEVVGQVTTIVRRLL